MFDKEYLNGWEPFPILEDNHQYANHTQTVKDVILQLCTYFRQMCMVWIGQCEQQEEQGIDYAVTCMSWLHLIKIGWG